jgi:hypothetical protein
MDKIVFVDKVKKNFSYLGSEYGFKVTRESNSNVRAQTDGAVVYTSKTTVVVIDSETGYVGVKFYRIQDGKNYYLDPAAIHEFLSTDDMEKKLLLSTDPKYRAAASALFKQKFLLNQPIWMGSNGMVDDVEKELGNFAVWLREHANLCLTGDFSRWPKFYEYKMLRLRADCLRRGEDELEYVEVKDADGNYQLVKQPIFKDKFDYIEKLKKEFSR